MKKLILTFLLVIVISSHALSQWVQMPNGMGIDKDVYSITVSGNNLLAGTYQYAVYISTNYGTNWTQIALVNKTVTSFATLGNKLFAGTYQYGVYLSTDNGTSWTQTALNNQTIFSLVTLGNNLFAGTDFSGIYFSTNNGINWTQTVLNNKMINTFATLGSNIFAGTGSGIYLSTNYGTHWTQTALNNKTIFSLATFGNNILAGTFNNPSGSGNVYLSTNNGVSWTLTAMNNQNVFSLATFGNNIFAGTDSGIYLSTNNGISWAHKNQGFNVIPKINAFLIANNYIFAGTNDYSLWRRSYSEIIGINKISEIVPADYSLSQNYPNPFNPSTKIRYDIPKSSFVKLVIFDALGREVQTLVNEHQSAGTYEAMFNGSAFASGVYFYKLTVDNFMETKKLLLIK